MNTILIIIQLVVALGLLNVWLLRFKKSTAYRGGSAVSMMDEFHQYGLPSVFVYIVGALKIVSAMLLIAGIWFHQFVLPAASIITVLMVGAIAMHIKVQDPVKKSIPALILLILSLTICSLVFWGNI